MGLLIASAVFGAGLICSLIFDFSIYIPMILGMVCFALAAVWYGHKPASVLKMMGSGLKTAFIVLKIFVLIGCITGVWRASGTIGFLVYYGIKLIPSKLFIIGAFLMTCVMSFLLGSGLGTAGTIGVVMIVLGKTGNADMNLVAGAVLSGAFFGDRCSFVSSNSNFIAAITKTDIFSNVKRLMSTNAMPLALSAAIYLALSFLNPMKQVDEGILNEISQNYDLSLIAALPAIVLLVMSLLKFNVKVSMFASVISGVLVAIFSQGESVTGLIKTMVLGYVPDFEGTFAQLIEGGGIKSMLTSIVIVAIASTYSGIFDGTGMLNTLQDKIYKLSCRIKVYPATLIISWLSNAFGCNQTLGVVLTHQLMQKTYEKNCIPDNVFATDLSDTASLTAELVPWNIALTVSLTLLSASLSSVPWAFYIYLVPLIGCLRAILHSKDKNSSEKA